MKSLLCEELICINVAVYPEALTRGKKYTILACDYKKHQVRLEGDNKKIRWFPTYCFDQIDLPVAALKEYQIHDPISSDKNQVVDVSVILSNGEKRWCIFVTPFTLAGSGPWIEGTKIHFHYCNRHIIITEVLSEDLIGRILTYIDSQGKLIECTIPDIEKNAQT